MLVRVVYTNDTYDMVKDSRLDEFIRAGRIQKFRRADGWVTIGADPIRSLDNRIYAGPEKRGSHPNTV